MLAKLLLFAAASTAAVVLATPGEAQLRHRRHPAPYYVGVTQAPPLTIHQRSYLDPGNVVAPGTGGIDGYIADNTYLNAPYVTKDLFHSRFGSGLPNRFELPGRPEPLFVFETPRDPF